MRHGRLISWSVADMANPIILSWSSTGSLLKGKMPLFCSFAKVNIPANIVVGRERNVGLSNNVDFCSRETYNRRGSNPVVVAVNSQTRAIKIDSKGRFPANACTGAVASHYCS